MDHADETYEIEISGQKRIKTVMKQFDNEYLLIVDNLRIMGDALVLLNPIRKIPTIVHIDQKDEQKITDTNT